MMNAIRESGDFDYDAYIEGHFNDLMQVLQSNDCDYQFTALENDVAYSLIRNFRFEQKNDALELNVVELTDEVKQELNQEVDYFLFVSQYHIDADIESKQPAQTVYFDFRKSDFSPLVSDKASGKLYQLKIQDSQKREELVMNSLAKKLCQKITKNR